jgi:DNA-binding PucR family transcriptional regulator
VLWRASEDEGDLETAAHELTRALGGHRPLTVPISPTVLWAWVASDDPPPHHTVAELGRFPRSDGVSTAVGEPARGAAGFAASHADAQDAQRVALLGRRRAGTTVVFGKVELAAMLSADLERTRRFVRRHLGALATDDDEHARLRATLRIYLDEHRSRQATAERLGVHVNTVGNRLRVCQRILDRDLDEPHLELHVALVLAERLGRAAFA